MQSVQALRKQSCLLPFSKVAWKFLRKPLSNQSAKERATVCAAWGRSTEISQDEGVDQQYL
jgi:hypothetical protein